MHHALPALGLPDFHFGYAMAVIDVPWTDVDLCVLGLRNKSGAGVANIKLRERQSDLIVGGIRDAQATGLLPSATPFVVAGDLKVLDDPADPHRHPLTLMTGDIVNEAAHGPNLAMDWDGTALADARPGHNAGLGAYYTWRNDTTPFPPGALDRILFTDSVLILTRAFMLDTTKLSAEALEAAGLRSDDVLVDGAGCYDHLPLVADFVHRRRSASERTSR